MSCAIYVPQIPFKRHKKNRWVQKWIAPSMSLKSHSNLSKKFIAIPWKWTTECFKTDCGQNLRIEISFFNNFLTKLFRKKTSKNSLPTPLSLLNKTHLQNRSVSSSSSPFLTCAIHARPKHGSSAGWGGLAVANAFRKRLLSSSPSPCLTCAIYVVWNCLETGPILGAYCCFRKGDAPSMWHILVRLVYGCREIWGSCAIYVGRPSLILANEWELRHLCPKKAAWCWGENMGANQRRRLQ